MARATDKFNLPVKDTSLADSAMLGAVMMKIGDHEPGLANEVYKMVLLQELSEAQEDLDSAAKLFELSKYRYAANLDRDKARRYLKRAVDSIHQVSKMAPLTATEKKSYQKKRLVMNDQHFGLEGRSLEPAVRELTKQVSKGVNVPKKGKTKKAATKGGRRTRRL